jgi:hypothetical protein
VWSQPANAKSTKPMAGPIIPTIVLIFLTLVLDSFPDTINQSENQLHGIENNHNNRYGKAETNPF